MKISLHLGAFFWWFVAIIKSLISEVTEYTPLGTCTEVCRLRRRDRKYAQLVSAVSPISIDIPPPHHPRHQPNDPATNSSPKRVALFPSTSTESECQIGANIARRHLRVSFFRAPIALCFFAKGCDLASIIQPRRYQPYDPNNTTFRC
jgi:hypothetical protein